MNGNEKQNQRLETATAVVVMSVALLAVPDRVSAQDGQYQVQTSGPQAVFESDKAWKFKDDTLVFFNPSPNPDGVRYIRWKDYTWVITASQITVIDERPYGTQIQGQRGLLTEDGPQKDKDLMDDLKRQAGDIRKNRESGARYSDSGYSGPGYSDSGYSEPGYSDPGYSSDLPIGIGLGLGLGVGFGFGFSGYDRDCHRGHYRDHHRDYYRHPSPQPCVSSGMQPTVRPISMHPTVRPSMQPTVRPSMQPTVRPSMQPTVRPSMQPTVRPSMQPTVRPNMQPTVQPAPQHTVRSGLQSGHRR